MTLRRRSLLLASVASAAGAPASALGCGNVAGSGEVHLVGNSFPALAHIARIAESCARPGLRVVFKLTPQARPDTEQAFGSKGPSPFDAALVSMAAFANLYARRQLQPLTDLVQKYGPRYRLEERMLVRVDGEVMAIAFMQNTQNLYYRAGLFAKHKLAVPTDYAQMVQAAGRFGTGVALAQRAGAPVWPSEPFFSLAHAEVGKVLPDALPGDRTPQAVLNAAAAAYLRSATMAGFIKPASAWASA